MKKYPLFAVLLFASILGASECALTVHFIRPDSTPASGTYVRFIDPSGQELFAGTVDFVFRMCDFGFGEHLLKVGENSCYPTTISRIRYFPGRPILLRVSVQQCTGVNRVVMGCDVYLRIHNQEGEGIPGAQVAFYDRNMAADEFGRIMLGLPRRSVTEITVAAPNYLKNRLSITCEQSRNVEEAVVLTRVRMLPH